MKNGLIIDGAKTKRYYLDDKLHRVDGPALEYTDGGKQWILFGELHRIDVPAFESPYGRKEWWFHGKHIDCETQEDFKRLIKLKAFW